MYIFKAKCNIQFEPIFRVQIYWRKVRHLARIIIIVDPSSLWILRYWVIFFVLKENINIFKRLIIILYANRVSQWNFAIVNQLRKSNHFKRILDVYFRSIERADSITPEDVNNQEKHPTLQQPEHQPTPTQPKPSTPKSKKCRNKSPSSRSSTVATHQHWANGSRNGSRCTKWQQKST